MLEAVQFSKSLWASSINPDSLIGFQSRKARIPFSCQNVGLQGELFSKTRKSYPFREGSGSAQLLILSSPEWNLSPLPPTQWTTSMCFITSYSVSRNTLWNTSCHTAWNLVNLANTICLISTTHLDWQPGGGACRFCLYLSLSNCCYSGFTTLKFFVVVFFFFNVENADITHYLSAED